MRVKLDHKPGKPEVVIRVNKKDAEMIELAVRRLHQEDPTEAKALRLADDVRGVLDTYPEALL